MEKAQGKIYVTVSDNSEALSNSLSAAHEFIEISESMNLDSFDPSLIFVDSNANNIQFIKKAVLKNPHIKFVLYYKDIFAPEVFAEFINAGVSEVVDLVNTDDLKDIVKRLYENSDDSRLLLYNQLFNKFRDLGIISADLSMAEIFLKIEKIAKSNSTVLITGENGTGKELIAKSIHFFSKRKDHRFVGVNTGAIPENLLEDELFGHVKGAFTSASRERKGKFEWANRGTIFLDEISNMPQLLQVKLLRVLQEREFEKVGDNESVKVDLRVVAATNKDLQEMVKNGEFREDLFYRLNVIPLELPPLRKRVSDIPVLANYFILKYSTINNFPVKSFNVAALKLLQSYSWPGNIRQLENVVERMVVLNPEKKVFLPSDIPEEIRPDTEDVDNFSADKFDIPEEGVSLKEFVKNIEKKMILNSLEKTSWNKQKAADLLNIKRTTLVEKIKKFKD